MAFVDKDKEISYKKRWYYENQKRILEARKSDYVLNAEVKKRLAKEYYYANKEAILAKNYLRNKLRRRQDPRFRLLNNLRKRVWDALAGKYKSATTITLIGCDVDQLRSYLEGLFKPGMSWDNYGHWHIDHIKPCKSFDLTDPNQQKQCFHFSNLQPLWAIDNMKKGAKES